MTLVANSVNLDAVRLDEFDDPCSTLGLFGVELQVVVVVWILLEAATTQM